MYDSLIGSSDFLTYNLQSSIGPLGPQATDPSTADWVGLNTSLGSFTVTSFNNIIFQATVGTATPGPTPAPDSGFQVRYAANLNIGESYIDITNDGAVCLRCAGWPGNPATSV